ncbi:hypothetical protein IRJ41_018081, partial [Triplophysa rosa]
GSVQVLLEIAWLLPKRPHARIMQGPKVHQSQSSPSCCFPLSAQGPIPGSSLRQEPSAGRQSGQNRRWQPVKTLPVIPARAQVPGHSGHSISKGDKDMGVEEAGDHPPHRRPIQSATSTVLCPSAFVRLAKPSFSSSRTGAMPIAPQ